MSGKNIFFNKNLAKSGQKKTLEQLTNKWQSLELLDSLNTAV